MIRNFIFGTKFFLVLKQYYSSLINTICSLIIDLITENVMGIAEPCLYFLFQQLLILTILISPKDRDWIAHCIRIDH